MSNSYGPRTSLRGLVLLLDSANTQSYFPGQTSLRNVAGSEILSIFNTSYGINNFPSVYFSGSSSYGEINRSINKKINGSSEITFNFWFRGSNARNILTLQNEASYYITPMFEVGGNLRFITSALGNTIGPEIPSSLICDGGWHFVSCVYKKNSFWGIYVDGSLISTSNSFSFDLPSLDSNDTLSQQTFKSINNDNYTNGEVSFLSIHNVALSQSEVFNAYLSLKPRFEYSFSMYNIGDMSLWLDISSTQFLSLDESNGVSSVVDRSKNGYACIQTDSLKRPIYTPGLLNGLGGCIYDGTNDCLLVNSFQAQPFITVFHVLRPRSASVNKPFFTEHGADVNGNNGFFIHFGSGPDTAVRRSPNMNSNSTNPFDQMRLTAPILATHIFDGALDSTGQIVRIRKNKIELITFKHITNTNITVSNTRVVSTLNIGARNNGNSVATSGTLHELIIFDRVLNDFEIFLVENYFYSKYFP